MNTKTLQAKLVFGFLLSIIASLALAIVDVYSVKKSNDALAYVYENRMQPTTALQEMDSAIKEIRFRMAGVLLDQLPTVGSRNHLKETRGKIFEDWDNFKKATSENERNEETKAQITRIDKQIALLPAFLDKLDSAYERDEKSLIAPMLEDEWPAFHSGLIKPISELLPAQQLAVKQTYETSKANGRRLILFGIAVFGTSLLVMTIFGWHILKGIKQGFQSLRSGFAQIAQGNLQIDIISTGQDEFGQMANSLQDMKESLANIVGNVRAATDSITTASQEISQGNSDLSQRTEEQASSLQETASSMEQMTATVKHNADNAKQANQLATDASNVAIKGGQVVNEVVQTMASITDSSKKIVDIISVIEGIAFQTNILALNAAVEAARAGEQGRGFAVVAGEVRNLAQRSAAAAKEIKTLIGDSVLKVNTGSKLVDQAGATMGEIVSAVKRVTDIMSEISAASSEQSTGIEQVSKAIMQMDETTQQNAALVEQAAAASESMEEQANSLMKAVSIFKLDDAGRSTQKTIAKPTIAHAATTAATITRKERKLVTAKDDIGDWKEF